MGNKKRCNFWKGCRTLTAQGLCEEHQAEVWNAAFGSRQQQDDLDDDPILQAAPLPDEPAVRRPAFDAEAFLAAFLAQTKAEWSAQARERAAAKMAERREELEGLKRAAHWADRAGERPVFSHAE
jgi:hypothetical protein